MGELVCIVALIAGITIAIKKWSANNPEWVFYRQFVQLPLADATGPDKQIFGYLPGAKGLLAPFVLSEPLGFFVFLMLNAASCVMIFLLIFRNFGYYEEDELGLSRMAWLSICMAAPTYFALQNNQLVPLSVALLIWAMVYVQRRKELLAGLLLALAALFKTLPIPMFILPLLCRRWKSTIYAFVLTGFLSFGLAAISDGLSSSVHHHLLWPSQVGAQDPELALDKKTEPRAFVSNQSMFAEIVRVDRELNIPAIVSAYKVFFGLTLLLLVALSYLRSPDHRIFWQKTALWMAWIAFAAPFARYYYMLFLVPAWYELGLHRYLPRYSWRRILWYAPLLGFCARRPTPIYAIAALVTMLLSFIYLFATLKSQLYKRNIVT